MRTWNSKSAPFWVEREAVGDRLGTVVLELRVEDQLRLDRGGDVVVVVLVTGEVQLSGQQFVTRAPTP